MGDYVLNRQGPSEFHVTGTLKEWTVIDDIPKIAVPTLLVNGRYDEAQDSVMYPFFQRLNKVKWVQLSNSGHVGHLEETDRCLEIVGDFLTTA